MQGTIVAVAAAPAHRFSKEVGPSIRLAEGEGVVGDAHRGVAIQHRSRVARDPTAPNLRQVHLIHAELFEELSRAGFAVVPGDLGENVTTRGIDLLGLSAGTVLTLGDEAAVEITGLRSLCKQLDAFRPGLMQAVLGRDAAGGLVRKAGIMGVVRAGGTVRAGDVIRVLPPPGPFRRLGPV